MTNGAQEASQQGAAAKGVVAPSDKTRMRGKGSSFKRLLRKNSNIIDARKEAIKKRVAEEEQAKEAAGKPGGCHLVLYWHDVVLTVWDHGCHHSTAYLKCFVTRPATTLRALLYF